MKDKKIHEDDSIIKMKVEFLLVSGWTLYRIQDNWVKTDWPERRKEKGGFSFDDAYEMALKERDYRLNVKEELNLESIKFEEFVFDHKGLNANYNGPTPEPMLKKSEPGFKEQSTDFTNLAKEMALHAIKELATDELPKFVQIFRKEIEKHYDRLINLNSQNLQKAEEDVKRTSQIINEIISLKEQI